MNGFHWWVQFFSLKNSPQSDCEICPQKVNNTKPVTHAAFLTPLSAGSVLALHCDNTLIQSDFTLSAELQLCCVSSPVLSFAAQLDLFTLCAHAFVHAKVWFVCIYLTMVCAYIIMAVIYSWEV